MYRPFVAIPTASDATGAERCDHGHSLGANRRGGVQQGMYMNHTSMIRTYERLVRGNKS